VDLFITDLDKTLLRSDLTVSPFTRQVWNSFDRPLSIATARSLKGATTLLKGLKLELPMILLDGAMIATTEEIIRVRGLEEELTETIISQIDREWGFLPLIVGLDREYRERFLYPERLNIHQQILLRKYKNDQRLLNLQELRPLPHTLKIVYLGDQKEMEGLRDFVGERFPVEMKLSRDPYQPSWFLTLLHPLGDKSHALKELEEIVGIPKERVTVFGDSLNDLGIFRASGRAVAVKNALPQVREAAHIVLPHTNDEDGVARYLASLKEGGSFRGSQQ